MGTPALTSRGFIEKDFEVVAALVDRGVTITQEIKKRLGKEAKLKDFREYLEKEVGGCDGACTDCQAEAHPPDGGCMTVVTSVGKGLGITLSP